MKKNLLLIIALLCAVAQGTWAETVSTAEQLAAAVNVDGNNIKLANDIALPDPLNITVKATIDMNGHKLTHQNMVGHDNYYNCIFVVANTGELHLKNGTIADVVNTTQNNTDYIAGAICNKGIVDLDNVTINNCKGLKGGAIRNFTNGTLTLSSCTLDGNTATGKSADGQGYGGAIYNEGALTLTSSIIRNNTASNQAGAIWNTGDLSVTGTTFKANSANTVSAIYHDAHTSNGKKPATISGCSFENNTSNGSSGCGAIRSMEGATKMTINSNTSFTNNSAPSYGGAIYCESVMELNKVNFTGNTVSDKGGAVFISPNGEVTMKNTTNFTGNTASRGAAVYNYGKLTVDGITVGGNTAKEYGGGILDEGEMAMSGVVVISDNYGNNGNQTSNLYLRENKVITIKGSLAGSTVGINMEKWGVFTSNYSKYNSGVDPATLFKSDQNEKFYGASLSGEEVVLSVKPLISIDNDADLRTAVALQFDNINIQLTNDIKMSNSTLSIPSGKTITLDLGGFTLDRKLTKRGEGGGQVITIREGATLNLSNGTLKSGWGGNAGGLVNEKGTANLTDVIITGCVGDDRGGGICNFGTLTMKGGAITGNTSKDKEKPTGGGGIFNAEGATVSLTGVTITGNVAKTYGGGGVNNWGTLTIDGCTITGNTSNEDGSGVWSGPGSTLNMQGKNTITDNTRNGMTNNVFLREGVVINVTGSLAGSSIGVIMEDDLGTFTSGYKKNNSDVDPATVFKADNAVVFIPALSGDEAALTLKPLIIVANDADLRTAASFDGANIQLANDIKMSNSTLVIGQGKTVTIDLNGKTLDRGLTSRDFDHGGQVITVRKGGTLNLSNGKLTGGYGGNGGGIANEEGTATLTDVNITGCTGDQRGGGISNYGTLTMTGGSITNNTSNDIKASSSDLTAGGGIFTSKGSTTTLTGVTITGNKNKTYGGGGICNFGTLTIDGCAITGNTAGANGGAIWQEGTLNLQGKNTITDNQAGSKANNVYLYNTVITVTGSLEGSQIGIRMEKPGTFTSGYSAQNKDVAPLKYFLSDNDDYTVTLRDNEAALSNKMGNGIQSVTMDNGQWIMDNCWYTLDGRKIAEGQKPTAKGVYIYKGKKVVIK